MAIGAFGNNENDRSKAPGGISLRQPKPQGATTIRPDYRTHSIMSQMNNGQGFAQNVPPGKQGMTHMPPQTGFMPKMPNPGFGYSGSSDDYSAGALNPPATPATATTPPTEPAAPNAAAAPATLGKSQADMLAEQNAAFKPQKVGDGMYLDEDTNTYAGSPEATQAGAFTNYGQQGEARTGGVAFAPNFGPFGRTPQEQSAIENRVMEIQRATNFIRGMRDVPTELDRMKQAAGARVSLDQGLGGFLQAGSDRKYARQRVEDLEKNALAEGKLAADAQETGFEQEYKRQKLAQDNIDVGTITLPDGTEIPTRTDKTTGEVQYGEAPKKPMTEPEAMTEFGRLADKMESDANFGTEEVDIFGGVTRDEWIKGKVAEAVRGNKPAEAPASTKIDPKDLTQENLEYTAKQNNMTVAELKKKLGVE